MELWKGQTYHRHVQSMCMAAIRRYFIAREITLTTKYHGIGQTSRCQQQSKRRAFSGCSVCHCSRSLKIGDGPTHPHGYSVTTAILWRALRAAKCDKARLQKKHNVVSIIRRLLGSISSKTFMSINISEKHEREKALCTATAAAVAHANGSQCLGFRVRVRIHCQAFSDLCVSSSLMSIHPFHLQTEPQAYFYWRFCYSIFHEPL